MQIYGEDMHCPMWNCMSELTMTLATIFVVQLTVQQAVEVGQPLLKQLWQSWRTNRAKGLRQASAVGWVEEQGALEEGGGASNLGMSEEEAQALLPEHPGVIDDYAVFFPATPLIVNSPCCHMFLSPSPSRSQMDAPYFHGARLTKTDSCCVFYSCRIPLVAMP